MERLFVARMELGMFDDPSKVAYTQIPYDCVDSLAHRALALKVSQKSLVLLSRTLRICCPWTRPNFRPSP